MYKTWSRPTLMLLVRGRSAETVLQTTEYCKCYTTHPKYGSESDYGHSVCGVAQNSGCATCYHTGMG